MSEASEGQVAPHRSMTQSQIKSLSFYQKSLPFQRAPSTHQDMIKSDHSLLSWMKGAAALVAHTVIWRLPSVESPVSPTCQIMTCAWMPLKCQHDGKGTSFASVLNPVQAVCEGVFHEPIATTSCQVMTHGCKCQVVFSPLAIHVIYVVLHNDVMLCSVWENARILPHSWFAALFALVV